MTGTIVEFLAHLRQLDVQVSVEGDRDQAWDQLRLRCNAPEGTLTPQLRQELADRKAELLAFLQQVPAQPTLSAPAIQPCTTGNVFPLSFAQQRLWFLYQLTPENPFYNVPAAIRLTGSVNVAALEQAFQSIMRRHAALRTRFAMVDGQPVQVVAEEGHLSLTVIDLQSTRPQDRDSVVQRLTTAEAQRPFDLKVDLPLRVTLLQCQPTEAILLLTLHHIVADGWSLGILVRELAGFYTALVEERAPDLPTLPIQYADFACWQRQWLQGEVLETQLTYWQEKLQDLPTLDLPCDRARPATQTYRGATYPLHFSPALTQGLIQLSQQAGVSLFMVLLAAFQTLLYRYTGQEDIAIGAPIANRHYSELENLIGFFVNSLVLRTDVSGNPPFYGLLGRVRSTTLAAYEHQDLPFEKLVEALEPERDMGRNPLFQIGFALQNAPMQSLELPGLTLEPVPLDPGTTRFDLEVHLWEPAHGLNRLWQSEEGLSGFVSYSTDLFDRSTVGRLIDHFQTLLEGIVANPNARLSELPILTPVERQQLLFDWSHPILEVPDALDSAENANVCFHQLFEAQVEHDPDAIALVSDQGPLTYGELNRRADDLAQTLRHWGVQPDTLVGLCVERSPDMLIGILGILKSGGAYVPLDPQYPRDRIQFMLTDAQVSILITQSGLIEKLPPTEARVLCLDQPDWSSFPSSQKDVSQTSSTETPQVEADHLAYVIYTSGSTGIPKGVLISHRSLCNTVLAQRVFQPSSQSRVLQFSSLSFDASVFEIALALGTGGTLYLPPEPAQLPGAALIQFLRDNAITHALLTPAVLAVLPSEDLSALQVLVTGGEACPQSVVDRWAVGRRFFNAYGPTEATIWATVAELKPGDNPLSIGRPIANAQVYVLDGALNPVPVGIAGELYIGGAGLARGYWNRPDLTAERFVANPFNRNVSNSAQRLYRTGDRVRYGSDGTLEFLGRVDDQIKLRGFRVELGEIEATLQRHEAVHEAVVLAAQAQADLRLIAYFTLNQPYLQKSGLAQLVEEQQIQHWQTLYNQTYQPSEVEADFNITGWNSSYTGAPIPPEQMREWVCDRVQQILALKPQRVLEIGCGTGLLLFQIAPHCQEYWAMDFSAASLALIEQQLPERNLPQVKLLHQMATHFEEIAPATFDVVILNSVVQYFPSSDYLMRVLQGAIASAAPGGVVFVGDVRSLPLLKAFHTSVQLAQADAGLDPSRLKQQVERACFEEPELLLDPAFFDQLCDRFPQLSQVQIRLNRGRGQNEMTQFRYNVLLHLAGETEDDTRFALEPHSWLNWAQTSITVAQIQSLLQEAKPPSLGIAEVANRRISAAVRTADWLDQTAPKTVGQMRELLSNAAIDGIDPQDWWDLETLLPYQVEISWADSSQTGAYNVVLIRQGSGPTANTAPGKKLSSGSSSQELANNPLQAELARHLLPDLRRYLAQRLPDYMVPSGFVPLAHLPLTPNGKVDRKALPPWDAVASQPDLPTSEVMQSQTETQLIGIWQDLLQVKPVGLHSNFFELGGHSLLATQMASRLQDTFGIEVPLRSVFEAPTIAQLAAVIEALRQTPLTQTIPALVKLDRAAHRRLRSNLANGGVALSSNSQVPSSDQYQAPVAASKSTSNPVVFLDSRVEASEGNPRPSPLVPLTLGGTKPPFFCVHPIFGVVLPYLELAHYLGCDRSFYGLQPLGLTGEQAPLTQIEAMAAYYLRAVQRVQPEGPYFLGGWSFGGLVAFEMAQQLTRSGERVELLAILDTPAPANYQLSLCKRLKYLLGTALWSALPFLMDYGAMVTDRPIRASAAHPTASTEAAQSPSWKRLFSQWQWSAITQAIPEEARLQLLHESAILPVLRVFYANSRATLPYKPQPYADPITLFKAVEQVDSTLDATLGWGNLAENVQVHPVPGNHLSMMKLPHVQMLAQQLQKYLS